MGKYRQDRINDAVVKAMAEILRGVKDPRVANSFITVTGARVSPDLKYAKIYFSSLSGDPAEIKRGLKSASGYIRGRLAEELNMRMTPELTFEEDESVKRSAKIASILREIEYTSPDENNQDSDEKSDEVNNESDKD